MSFSPRTITDIPEVYSIGEILGTTHFLIGCLMESKSYRMLNKSDKMELVEFCLTAQGILIQAFEVAKPTDSV